MKRDRGRGIGGLAALASIAAALILAAIDMREAHAEFGDVVMNQYSDTAGMRPVVFPHWFHRVRYSCKACHGDLGIQYKAGGNGIMMLKIIDGLYCGACHNGTVAWSVEQCDLCHSGKPGTPTQVHESTVLRTGTPPAAGKRK
jgi:c(7)-type cytochrome triheme protein